LTTFCFSGIIFFDPYFSRRWLAGRGGIFLSGDREMLARGHDAVRDRRMTNATLVRK
jgi:hypothetical protein